MIKLIVNYKYSTPKRIGFNEPKKASQILTFDYQVEITNDSIKSKLNEGDSYIELISIYQVNGNIH